MSTPLISSSLTAVHVPPNGWTILGVWIYIYVYFTAKVNFQAPERSQKTRTSRLRCAFHDRSDGSSWIFKFAYGLEAAIRYAFAQSKLTSKYRKGPKRSGKVYFDMYFTLKVMGRVGYVNSRTDLRLQFDMYFQSRG